MKMSLLKSILMSESYRATSKLMASLAILSHGKMSGSGRSPSPSVHPHVKHQSHIWVLVYHTMWCISKVCKKNIKTNTFKENEWLNSLQLAVHRDITVVLKRKKTTDLSATGPEQEFPSENEKGLHTAFTLIQACQGGISSPGRLH